MAAAAATEDAFHSLERRFIVLQQDHERVKKERDELQRRLTDAAAEATQSNAKIASLQQVRGVFVWRASAVFRLTDLINRPRDDLSTAGAVAARGVGRGAEAAGGGQGPRGDTPDGAAGAHQQGPFSVSV